MTVKDISNIISKIDGKLDVKNTYPVDADIVQALSVEFDLDTSQVTEYLNRCLSLVLPPEGLNGVLRLRAALEELVFQILHIPDVQTDQLKLAVDLLSAWFSEMKTSQNKNPYLERIYKEKNPVAAFYAVAAPSAKGKTKEPVNALFWAFCLKFHEGIKKVLKSGITKDTTVKYLLACRHFFAHSDEAIKYDKSLLSAKKDDDEFISS